MTHLSRLVKNLFLLQIILLQRSLTVHQVPGAQPGSITAQDPCHPGVPSPGLPPGPPPGPPPGLPPGPPPGPRPPPGNTPRTLTPQPYCQFPSKGKCCVLLFFLRALLPLGAGDSRDSSLKGLGGPASGPPAGPMPLSLLGVRGPIRPAGGEEQPAGGPDMQ